MVVPQDLLVDFEGLQEPVMDLVVLRGLAVILVVLQVLLDFEEIVLDLPFKFLWWFF